MSNVAGKKKRVKNHRFIKITLISLLLLFLVAISIVVGVTVAIIRSSPTVNSNIISHLIQSSKIYDMNGKYIEDYSGPTVRSVVSLNQISPNLQNAFIAIEDHSFWTHHGIDLKRIVGAFIVDIKTGASTQGASTITQQLVKNVFLNQKKVMSRKIQEAYMSLQLERKLSKQQILEAYLNTVYMGGSLYGVEAASENYFGVPASKLTLSQAAFLAGMNKSPYRYYPRRQSNIDNNFELLVSRRNVVLNSMLKMNYISEAQYIEAYNDKLTFKKVGQSKGMKYQWFIEPAIDQVALDFSKRYGISKNDAKEKLRLGGYSIYLTIDPKIQQAAEQAVNDNKNFRGVWFSKGEKAYSEDSKLTDDSGKPLRYAQPQAAAVIYDYKTGQMRAIVGGRGPHPRLSINRATEVPRQPGSSIKPLAVYGPAIDTKTVNSSTIIMDTPMSRDFVKTHNGWNPHNYETHKFTGIETIRDAIRQSINIVAIKVLNLVNPDPASGPMHNTFSTSIDYLQNKFHITTLKTSGANSDLGLSPLALGALTQGVYPYEMAAAYGVFGNAGIYSTPILYTKVEDNSGDVVLEDSSQKSQSISADAAYIMTDMLKGVVKNGTGTRASLGSMPAAGKTGTASNKTNLWFCGLTPYYSGAVWIGDDKSTVPMNGLASSNAANIWGQIMKKAHEGLTVKDFDRPTDLVVASVCTKSGKAPNDLCYKSHTVASDLFIDGTQPVEICDYHKQKQTILKPLPGSDATENDNGNSGNPTDTNRTGTDTNNGSGSETSPSAVDAVPPAQ